MPNIAKENNRGSSIADGDHAANAVVVHRRLDLRTLRQALLQTDDAPTRQLPLPNARSPSIPLVTRANACQH